LRFEKVLRHWSGAALALVGVIATLWLAASGRLTLYVHPRYTLLTVIMAVLTLLVLVLMAAVGAFAAAGEDGDHDHDVFFLARLAVSCCAVDAQPIGIPVYRPAWREQIEPGAWITIQGTFAKNPSPDSQESVAIGVGSLAKINEPDQPYVF
jgi:uncharacterized membrane protein YcgQ (UPF0703/DUF1980 family)